MDATDSILNCLKLNSLFSHTHLLLCLHLSGSANTHQSPEWKRASWEGISEESRFEVSRFQINGKCLGQWHREKVSLAQKKGWITFGHLEERGVKREDGGAKFRLLLLVARHQGNCVAMATAKAVPHLPITSSVTVTATPARYFRIGPCGPPETA